MAGHNEKIDLYVDCVLNEAQLRKSEIHDMPLHTVYFGGGTPSLLSIEQVSKLVLGLREVFDFSNVQEFTFEVNPDDVTIDYIHALRELGVNRISMGIQSFDDEELKLINRRHDSNQAIQAVNTIRQCGIENISVDLIYGIPKQSLNTWKSNVEKALTLGIQHISAYSMMYEKGTRLWVMREKGAIREIEEDESLAMYEYLVDRLRGAGFEHYEISNFAYPGFRSQHNSNYWNLTPYLGLGAAAHSYDGIVRRFNPSNLNKYIEALNNQKCVFEEEEETLTEKYNEYVMIRMRTSEGCDANNVLSLFGKKYHDYFIKQANNFIATNELMKENSNYYIPENKIMVTDSITRELFYE